MCYNCPVWEDCLEYGRDEQWGLWGGLTPQERRGTARLEHGTLELYRFGCRCPKCREASVVVMKNVTKDIYPATGTDFDIESLSFKISSA